MPSFTREDFGPPQFKGRPKAFGFKDLTTGKSYETPNLGTILYVVFDSPTYGAPKGERYGSKEEYTEWMWHNHVLVISGPYEDIFTLGDDFRIPCDIARLGVEDSGMLFLEGTGTPVVVKRPFRKGKTALIQYSSDRQNIEAYLLTNNPEIQTDKVAEDVCDLNNPRLGLQNLFRGRLLVHEGDELRPNVRYNTYPQGGALVNRGRDPVTGLNVFSVISRPDWAALEFKGMKRPYVPASMEIQGMLEHELAKKSGEDFLWSPETLQQEEQQVRLWDAHGEYLVRNFTHLTVEEDYSGFFAKQEKARFDEREDWIGPRLQMTYLY